MPSKQKPPNNTAMPKSPGGRTTQPAARTHAQSPAQGSVVPESVALSNEQTSRSTINALQAQVERLRALFELAPLGIVLNRLPNVEFIDGNPALFAMLGYTREEFNSLHFWDITPEAYKARDVEEIKSMRKKGRFGPYEKVLIHKQGHLVPVLVEGVPFVGPDGSEMIYTIVQDMSERKRAEAALMASERRAQEKTAQLEITLAHMNHGLSLFDAQGRLVLWNESYAQLFYPAPHLLCPGTSFVDLVSELRLLGDFAWDAQKVCNAMMARLAKGECVENYHGIKDGRLFKTTSSPIKQGGWVTIYEDITERERAAEKIAYAAHHDVLTGLANRAEIQNQLTGLIENAAYGMQNFSVFLLDLDRFKPINDTLGHAVGDQVLQIVAQRLTKVVGPHGVAARLGGDEFAVLFCPGEDVLGATQRLAQAIIDEISAPFVLEQRELRLGVSVGIAIAPEHGSDCDSLFGNADAALYKVKTEGRNAYRVFDEALAAEVAVRRDLRRDLWDAIANKQFELYYQPIVSAKDQHYVSVEALLRWRHPVRGLVPPDLFISLAEETGAIIPIGAWVLEQACQDAVHWPEAIRVAVNVSAAQLGGRLVEIVSNVLKQTNLAPHRLELEVTESIFLRDDPGLLSDLHNLHALGVRLALDDFGTGYSSIGYLRMLPFDKIKIDKSFIDSLTVGSNSAAIVCAIVNLAKSLSMTTTAEGVENTEQLDLLRAADCTHIQGYLLGKPMPIAELPFVRGFRAALNESAA
jgi:diguanylate cyclase (GGDEF)-like protein/PAS domain S-box-containing protein